MKKLLAGALCALSLAMPVCAANGDGNDYNDQNDNLGNAVVITEAERNELQGRLHDEILSARHVMRVHTEFIDTISTLIRDGAEVFADTTPEYIMFWSEPNFNFFGIFATNIDRFPENIKNHILGRALLFYVKYRCTQGLSSFPFDNTLGMNRKTVKVLVRDLNAPTNFTDDHGLTASQIAKNRYNTWKAGGTPNDFGPLEEHVNNSDVRQNIRIHDKNVDRLLNERDGSCTIL